MKYMVQYASIYDDRHWYQYKNYLTKFFALRDIAKKLRDKYSVNKWRLLKYIREEDQFIILYEFERKRINKYL